MRIDAHQHFWTLARGDYDWLTPSQTALYRDFEPDDLRPLLDAQGIAGTIAVQAAETVVETAHLLELAARHSWILGVVGWCDLGSPVAAAQVRSLARHPRLVGLRPMLQDLADPDWILKPAQADGVQAMETAGLVFDALIRPRHIARIAKLADRYPALSIVIDHAAKPAIGNIRSSAQWRTAMFDIARRPNVACKFSGLVTEAAPKTPDDLFQPYVDVLIEAFGTDRLIWGSDWPVIGLRSDYAGWATLSDALLARCSPSALAAIRGGNARRLYRLGDPGDLSP
jgi:L-fuconolactonase